MQTNREHQISSAKAARLAFRADIYAHFKVLAPNSDRSFYQQVFYRLWDARQRMLAQGLTEAEADLLIFAGNTSPAIHPVASMVEKQLRFSRFSRGASRAIVSGGIYALYSGARQLYLNDDGRMSIYNPSKSI